MMDFPFDIFGLVWGLFWIWLIVNGVLKFFGLLESGTQNYLRNRGNKWIFWQKLAKTHNLSFNPGNFLEGAKVFGRYGRYYLTLVTYKASSRSNSRTDIRLTLSATQPVRNNTFPSNSGGSDTPQNIEYVINLLTPKEVEQNVWGSVRANSAGQRISYEEQDIKPHLKYFQFLFDWLSEIGEAYPAIVALGGEAVQPLKALAEKKRRLNPLVTQLIHDIARKTTTQMGNQAKNLVCPYCFTHFDAHKVRLRWGVIRETATYYGCRTCHQSRDFFKGWVVARLDNQTAQEQDQHNGVLWVNWLSRRALFDFDEVEVVQATDEDVERFAVQVGNDTDPLRKSRYQHMRCAVSAGCDLSENTHRILQRMFGSVELREAEFIRGIADIHEGTTHHRDGATDSQTIHPGRRSGSSTFGR